MQILIPRVGKNDDCDEKYCPKGAFLHQKLLLPNRDKGFFNFGTHFDVKLRRYISFTFRDIQRKPVKNVHPP